jgi:hypothetical protein
MNGQRTEAMNDLMKPQLHINTEVPSENKMEPVRQGGRLPEGGLWTSTPDNEKDTWVVLTFASMDPVIVPEGSSFSRYRPNWAQRAKTGMPYRCWHVYPNEKARVATINTRDDLAQLGATYDWVRTISHPFFLPPIPFFMQQHWTLDFLAIAKDFDALRMTEHAVQEFKSPDPRYPGMDEGRLPTWGVESTCWFRWCFERVEELGMLRDYMKIPPWLFRREVTKASNGATSVEHEELA